MKFSNNSTLKTSRITQISWTFCVVVKNILPAGIPKFKNGK